MSNYVEVRCCSERGHFTRGVFNPYCSALLVGIDPDVDSSVLVKCKVCKTMWEVTCEDGTIIIEDNVDKEITR